MRKPDYWLDQYLVVKMVDWEKKPSRAHRPIVFADRPVPKEVLKALWVEAEGKPQAFARLIHDWLGIREYEVEEK